MKQTKKLTYRNIASVKQLSFLRNTSWHIKQCNTTFQAIVSPSLEDLQSAHIEKISPGFQKAINTITVIFMHKLWVSPIIICVSSNSSHQPIFLYKGGKFLQFGFLV
jgi:hypothetical protein